MPKKNGFKEGDLLYHAVHGLCRVRKVVKQKEAGKETLFYSLAPKVSNQMKINFLIEASQLETTGFHSPLTTNEANKILDYLKAYKNAGGTSPEEQNQALASFAQSSEAWTFARAILFFSRDKAEVKEQRKRQMLDRSVKGLVRELACVFEIPVNEAISKIRKSLDVKANPSVLAVLGNAVEDE